MYPIRTRFPLICFVLVPLVAVQGVQGTCQDDIGGPFTVQNRKDRHVLVGITSWGTGCAEVRTKVLPKPSHVFFLQAEIFSVFAEVAAQRRWIDRQIKAHGGANFCRR